MGETLEVLIKEIVGAVMVLARTPMPNSVGGVIDCDIAAGGQGAGDDLRSKNVACCRDTGIG